MSGSRTPLSSSTSSTSCQSTTILIVVGREQVVGTSTGCVCRVGGSDARESLAELLRFRREGAPAFARAIVETTGLADTAPLINSLVP